MVDNLSLALYLIGCVARALKVASGTSLLPAKPNEIPRFNIPTTKDTASHCRFSGDGVVLDFHGLLCFNTIRFSETAAHF